MEKNAKKQEQTTDLTKQCLEQLVLDRREGKYGMIAPMSWWAKELRKQEENRHLTQTDIIELAMHEVLSGKVSLKDLEKRMQEAGPAEAAAQDGAAEKPRKSDKKERKSAE
ncbi:MAG: hypothetical protein WCU88_13320 [Elusimicrobiota bacterium]|jgi:hypothetical protein